MSDADKIGMDLDILRFINSEDIREHLRSIGYKFTSLEAAWLIYQCHGATIKEKHEAWEKLIESMPDCKIEGRRGFGYKTYESLHCFLREYMRLEKKYIEEFMVGGSGTVYRIEYHCPDGVGSDPDHLFSSVGKACDKRYWADEVCSFKIIKIKVDKCDEEEWVILNRDMEITEIFPGEIDDGEDDIFYSVFDGLWFEFPTPFKKGDIVWVPDHPEGFCGGPFALTFVCLEGMTNEKRMNEIRRNGESTDMIAGGYFQTEEGMLYQEVMHSYMDLEYYDKELTGVHRTLIPFSNYLKGEIDGGLLMSGYHQILTQGYADGSLPFNITDEGLRLAGMPVRK